MSSASILRRPSVLLLLALLSVAGVVTLMGRLATGPKVEQKTAPLTSEVGSKAYPAFSPDGQRIAYSARGSSKVDPYHIYVRTVAPDTPRALTSGTGNDIGPVWSPDGHDIAFMRLSEQKAEYMVVPADGGAERKIAEAPYANQDAQPNPSVAWTHDGKALIVSMAEEKFAPGLFLITLDGSVKTRLTTAPEGADGDLNPVTAPDGSAIAFVRAIPDRNDIFVIAPTGGQPRQVTFDGRTIAGISWTPDSSELVYSANRFGGGMRLWRIDAAGGAPREIIMAGRRAQYPAVAPSGNRLAYAENSTVSAVWRATIGSDPANTDQRALIRSAGQENNAVYSPDGKRIVNVSEQREAQSLWLSDANGDNRQRILEFKEERISDPRWSPDGKTILFEMEGERGREIMSVAAQPGATPKRVIMHGANASYSRDGKHIYFENQGQIWKSQPDGGSAEPFVATNGVAQPVESLDGKWVYFRWRRSIWRIPSGGGKEEEFIIPDAGIFSGAPVVTKKGIYYSSFERSSRGPVIVLYDYATQKNTVILRTGATGFAALYGTFSVSPDDKYILFSKVDQGETNLMTLEGFK